MSRAFDITSGQEVASDRHDSGGVVYLLSGTFAGRHGVPDAPFYWSTREVRAPLGVSGADVTFEAYLAPPREILRSITFEPGGGASFPAVNVPIRNLPFAHSRSVVAAITDDDFAWENTEVTLRAAYLRPGENPDDLVAADWAPLVERGFFGPPTDVKLDALTLPVYNRGAKRNQALKWPTLPPATASGVAIDIRDAGKPAQMIFGRPDGWIRAQTVNIGVRGTTVSGYDAGSTVIQFRPLTAGLNDLSSGTEHSDPDQDFVSDPYNPLVSAFNTGKAGVMVHYRTPVYLVSACTVDPTENLITITLVSGLAAEVPRGALVQQHGAHYFGAPHIADNSVGDYLWNLSTLASHGIAAIGWLFPDGTVKPTGLTTAFAPAATGPDIQGDDESYPWPIRDGLLTNGLELLGGQNPGYAELHPPAGGSMLVMYRGTRNAPRAPVYWDPLAGGGGVTQQPEFVGESRADGKPNYPTGGTGVDNANARDGSEDTFATLALSDVITLTFNSAGAPFANGDTTASTLWVVAQGNVRFTDSTGGTTFGEISSIGSPQQFRFTQVAARDFNETVRCVGQTGGGAVHEAWWEHDLLTSGALERTADVIIGGAGATVGEQLVFADLVVRPLTAQGTANAVSATAGVAGLVTTPWRTSELLSGAGLLSGATTEMTYPTAVLASLQLLLGAEGDVANINKASYDAAQRRFVADDLRLNFVLTEPVSWSELEQEIGKQARSHVFYGPSGHEIIYMESASGYEALSVLREFRLPSTPGANCLENGSALFERTLTTELVNTVEATWQPNYLEGNRQQHTLASSVESIADVGVRKDTRGALDLWMHSAWDGHHAVSGLVRYATSGNQVTGSGSFDAAARVSGIAQLYADRQAYAATRFRFDTGWIGYGLDRGSLVRVAYPVALGTYRNVICEVEEFRASPLNAERVSIVARSVGKPQKGLTPAYTWVDQYTAEGMVWDDVLENDFDTFSDYWSVGG